MIILTLMGSSAERGRLKFRKKHPNMTSILYEKRLEIIFLDVDGCEDGVKVFKSCRSRSLFFIEISS